MKITAKSEGRLASNPEERRFLDAWKEQQESTRTLAWLLCPEANVQYSEHRGRPPEPTEDQHMVAATVVQWLGSPVGQCFLRDLGYEKT